MTSKPGQRFSFFDRVMVVDALVCVLAIGFDLATDRSFGAIMLAALPISLIGLACLVVGPWLKTEGRSSARNAWGVCALTILVVSIAFSMLGPDQAKSGEEIFTYAVMVMALPSSLVLPFAAAWLAPTLGDSVTVRMTCAWVVCAAAGWLEWSALTWLADRVRRCVAPPG